MKKISWILTLAVLALTVVFLRSAKPQLNTHYCPFCDPKILNQQVFYEDDLVLALTTHKPVVPGHVLIIPKRHVERFEMLTQAESARIIAVIKKINRAVTSTFGTFPYLLLQKNGAEVGQSVPHVHFHYIPRPAGSSSLALLFRFHIADFRWPKTPEEMQETIVPLKLALEENGSQGGV